LVFRRTEPCGRAAQKFGQFIAIFDGFIQRMQPEKVDRACNGGKGAISGSRDFARPTGSFCRALSPKKIWNVHSVPGSFCADQGKEFRTGGKRYGRNRRFAQWDSSKSTAIQQVLRRRILRADNVRETPSRRDLRLNPAMTPGFQGLSAQAAIVGPDPTSRDQLVGI